jgi:hypothetical protein
MIGWLVWFMVFNATLTGSVSTSNYTERRGRDHMVVGFTTTCASSAYHH